MPDRPTSSPGFYKARLVRGGPWVPVKTWYEDGDRDPETGELLSDQILRGLLGDTPFDPFGPLKDGRTQDFRDFARKVDRAEYERLLGGAHQDVAAGRETPRTRPREAIDMHKEPSIF